MVLQVLPSESVVGKKVKALDEKKVLHTAEFTRGRERKRLKNNSWLTFLVVQKYKLKAGHYLVVPCTHETGHYSKYSLVIYSTVALKVGKVSSPISTRRDIKVTHSDDINPRRPIKKRTKSTSSKIPLTSLHESDATGVKSQLKKTETSVWTLNVFSAYFVG